MTKSRSRSFSGLVFLIAILLLVSSRSQGQTPAFNYQGRLTDAGTPANGTYILQFQLFDAASGGSQVGPTIPDISITAANGVFSTALDFGAAAFTGGDRFLQISVKKLVADPYVELSQRQPIVSAPYAVRTLSAAKAD